MKEISKFLPRVVLLLLTACKQEDPAPELPPATQTGERTLGAYVNGEVWVPKGRPSFFQPNLYLVYDSEYGGGSFDMRAYRIEDNSDVKNYIQIGTGNIDKEGIYTEFSLLVFGDANCYYNTADGNVTHEGVLEITRLDMEAGIIAGRFEFTLAKVGCDTIRVTDGRFDYKL